MTLPVLFLAAGKSERMGEPKGLVMVNGKTWLEHQITRCAALKVPDVLISLGFHSKQYLSALPWLNVKNVDVDGSFPTTVGQHLGLKITTVFNQDAQFGPFSSIHAALPDFLRLGNRYLAICPVDSPMASQAVWAQLTQDLDATSPWVVSPTLGDRGGHPVLISRDFAETLVKLDLTDPDSRLDVQIRKLPANRVKRVEVTDATILANLNTPDELKKWVST